VGQTGAKGTDSREADPSSPPRALPWSKSARAFGPTAPQETPSAFSGPKGCSDSAQGTPSERVILRPSAETPPEGSATARGGGRWSRRPLGLGAAALGLSPRAQGLRPRAQRLSARFASQNACAAAALAIPTLSARSTNGCALHPGVPGGRANGPDGDADGSGAHPESPGVDPDGGKAHPHPPGARPPRPGVRWRRPDARPERPGELPERPDAGIGRVRTRLRSPARRPDGRSEEEAERMEQAQQNQGGTRDGNGPWATRFPVQARVSQAASGRVRCASGRVRNTM
jgi:hypothetical protein